MTIYMPFDREQLVSAAAGCEGLAAGERYAHFIVAAVERVRLAVVHTNARPSGNPQYHPRLMLVLLVYSHANGVFSSRRIERATYRDVGTGFIAANAHPDHDTIASFRRTTSRPLKRRFCRFCCWRARWGCCGWARRDRRYQDRCHCLEDPLAAYHRARAVRVKLAADIAALTARPRRPMPRTSTRRRCRRDRPARGAQGEARRCLRAVGSGSQGRGRGRTPAIWSQEGSRRRRPGAAASRPSRPTQRRGRSTDQPDRPRFAADAQVQSA